MSEFSESYHLKGQNSDEGINLLKKSGLKGYVFPQYNGWITLVAEGEYYTPNSKLINMNEGILLNFSSAEDHGWSFTIYKRNEKVSHYECLWGIDEEILQDELEKGNLDIQIEASIYINDAEYNETFMCEILNDDPIKLSQLKSTLYPKSSEDAIQSPYDFIEICGLKAEYCEWISYLYFDNDFEDFKENVCSEIIKVD